MFRDTHATSVTVGGFVMGTTLGWTSPAGPMLEDGQRGFPVTEDGVSWIASCVPLGALLGCPVAAGLVDALGRRNLMAALTLPAFVGWLTIIQADSVRKSFEFSLSDRDGRSVRSGFFY